MLVNVGKRVMAYTMPGPQANRGPMAGLPLTLITRANAEMKVGRITMERASVTK